jgi:hypothetical protein
MFKAVVMGRERVQHQFRIGLSNNPDLLINHMVRRRISIGSLNLLMLEINIRMKMSLEVVKVLIMQLIKTRLNKIAT